MWHAKYNKIIPWTPLPHPPIVQLQKTVLNSRALKSHSFKLPLVSLILWNLMFYHLFYLLLHYHTVAVQRKSELLTPAWLDAISPIDWINIQDTRKTIKGQINWKSVAGFWVYLTVPWFSTCCCDKIQTTLKISHQTQLNCYSFQNLVFISTF
jgi:hypothetical protein